MYARTSPSSDKHGKRRALLCRGSFFLALSSSLLFLSCGANPGTLLGLFSVGGTLSGLTGRGLVLQDNGGDNLALGPGATSFTFATKILSGNPYHVTVFSQPSGPSQTCVMSDGSGSVTTADISDVQVSCATNTYTIGGTISGLNATGLVLQDEGGNNLAIPAGATTFAFLRLGS